MRCGDRNLPAGAKHLRIRRCISRRLCFLRIEFVGISCQRHLRKIRCIWGCGKCLLLLSARELVVNRFYD